VVLEILARFEPRGYSFDLGAAQVRHIRRLAGPNSDQSGGRPSKIRQGA
jgi:hypothetical protein